MRRQLHLALAISLLISSSPVLAADDSEDLLPQADKSTTPSKASPAPKKEAPDSSSQAPTPAQILGPTTAPGSVPSPTAAQVLAPTTSNNLTVDDVKIEGNRLVATEDIMKVVKTKRGDKFDRDQVVQDLKAINSLGYFDDQKLQGTPELTKNGVLLKIRVQENAPVTEFSFQGNQAVSSEEISKVFSDQLGKPQNLNELSSAIDKVEQAYHDKGFILARVTDVKDDPDGSIGLSINEGVIDQIQIIGNHRTKDFIIRNAIKQKAGNVYNERLLTADLRKLFANGYFQDLRRSLAPSSNNPDKYTLKVEVEEKRTGSVSLGGGVDTVAGPFGSLGFSENNFQGKGQILSMNGMVGSGMFGQVANSLTNSGQQFLASQRTYQVQANFVEPNLGGTGVSMATSAYGRDLNSMIVSESMQQTIGTGVSFSKQLGNNLTGSLGFNADDTMMKDIASAFTNVNLLDQMASRAFLTGQASTIGGAENLANQVRNNQMKGGAFLSVNPSLRYSTVDNVQDPTRGTSARISASPSLGLTAGSFMKAGASVSQYIPLTRETTLALNMQGGAGLGSVPAFAQYRLGGFNGMRGYSQFSALGTGSSMLMATAEVRHRIPGLRRIDNPVAKVIDRHVKLDAFFDAGQVGGNGLTNSLYGMSNLGAAVGVGVRVNVPMIGTVRLDYGLPLLTTVMGGGLMPRFTVGFGEKF